MTPAITGRAFTEWLSGEVRKRYRRSCEDHGVSAGAKAGALDLSKSLVLGWWGDKHAPMYVLASRKATPDSLFERIVLDIRTLRAEQGVGLTTTTEAATAKLLVLASTVITHGAGALLDQHVDADERNAMRPAVAALRDWCDRWMREADAADRGGPQR